MLVLVAPDKFKGTLSARAAADAIGKGVRNVYPDAEVVLVPLGDGGDGTMEALRAGLGGEVHEVPVTGPDGRRLRAPVCRVGNGDVFVEMSLASGLALVASEERDPLSASSRGTGELVAAAAVLGARRTIVGIGGSASSDGGTGAASAIGWRFLDDRGGELRPGGGALVELAAIERPRALPVDVIGACDVTSPLLGPWGAARLFGPQKGAGSAEVQILERALTRLRDVVSRDLGVDIGAIERGGAGGGMGAGLVAFFGADLRSGFDLVADALDLRRRMAGAALVITGEGRIDGGTSAAKVPAGVAGMARERGVPCFAVAGRIQLPEDSLAGLGFAAAAESGPLEGRVSSDPFDDVVAATTSLLRAHPMPL